MYIHKQIVNLEATVLITLDYSLDYYIGIKVVMENSHAAVLIVCKTWNTGIHEPITVPTRMLIKKFRKETHTSGSNLYCSVLDEKVSEDQKTDAESVGVTLITATRSKWSDPQEDQPGVHWLLSHDIYYPNLKSLKDIKHVVSFSSETKNAAGAVHESLFPEAQLHLLTPTRPNGVLFTFDVWNRYACGLTGYHRAIIKEFCARKAEVGEHLIAYSTVVDSELSDEQKEDAEKCGVTLIPAKSEPGGYKGTQLSESNRFINHADYLTNLKNIQYVVGYAPKTGFDAAYIRKKFFPGAKLALINHAFPENNYLNGGFEDLEDQMLKMASEADLLFSIGPRIHEYFENAYRADEGGRKLSDIPHDEILPQVKQEYVNYMFKVDPGMKAYSMLTYGQLDTQKALEQCKSIATSIAIAANKQRGVGKDPEWKIQGVSANADQTTVKSLIDKVQSSHIEIRLYKSYSAKLLLRHIQQSHLCIPPSCYEDYSFEGLEAMASGLPTAVCDDSHLASLITKYFEEHEDYCVVEAEKLSSKITDKLNKISKGFKQAKLLKRSLVESEAIPESFANFTAMLKRDETLTSTALTNIKDETVKMQGQDDKTDAQIAAVHTVAKYGVMSHDGNSSDVIQLEAPTDEETTIKARKKRKQSHGKLGKRKLERNGVKELRAKSSKIEGKESRKRKLVECGKLITQQSAGAEQVHLKVQKVESNKHGPPFGVAPPREQSSGNDNIVVNVSLNEEGYRQEKTHLDRQPQTRSVMKNSTELQSSWERCNEELNKNAEQVIANSNSTKEVNHIICMNIGHVTASSMKNESLGMSLSIPTLYNLNRLKQTCRSGSFPNSFEPLLITDQMRKEADKVGLPLTLKATYDQARFDDLRLFFINRDGGGLGPVKVFQDIIEPEDAEEILIFSNITGSVESSDVSHDSSKEEKHQQFKDKKALTGKQSEPELERAILESQLNGAKREKAVLEERCKELTEKLESTEKALVSQRVENRVKRERIQSKLEEKERLIKVLQNNFGESEQKLEQDDLRKEEKKGNKKTKYQMMKIVDDSSTSHRKQRTQDDAPVVEVSMQRQATEEIDVTNIPSAMELSGSDMEETSEMVFPEILTATLERNVSKIAMLIERGADINASNPDEYTCLHVAAAAGDLEVVKYLIKEGITKDKRNKDKMTAVMLAVKNNRQAVVKFLVESGTNLELGDKIGYTPLHCAAAEGYTEVAKTLIDAKANIEALTKNWYTPLHLATQGGCTEVAKTLIDAKANIEALTKIGYTPLHCAAHEGYTEVAKTLIDAKANIEALTKSKDTPLRTAASNGHTDVVKILIDAGANKDSCDGIGYTPLHCAAAEGYTEVAKTLIDGKANIEALTKSNDTPLSTAASNGHTDVVKILIDAGANKDSCDEIGYTPLHCAAAEGYTEVAKTLIDAKANIEALTKSKDTPLSTAASNGHTDVVKILIDAGANKD